MSTVAESVPVSFAGLKKRGTVPAFASRYNVERSTASEVAKADRLPGVIVLNAGTQIELSHYSSVTKRLSDRIKASHRPCRILVTLSGSSKAKPDGFAKILKLFPGMTPHIEISVGRSQLESSFYEAMAKYVVQWEEQQNDPLATTKEVIAATRSIRARNGRLSAKAISGQFDISLSELADIIGRTKQSLSKTPDSPKIQLLLRPFERIARLTASLSLEDFRSWLNHPNRELDNAAPIDLIKESRVEIVADLAEDMLLGTPS